MKTKFALAAAMLTLAAIHAPADAASITGNGRSTAGNKAELVKSAPIKKAILIERRHEMIARADLRKLGALKRKTKR